MNDSELNNSTDITKSMGIAFNVSNDISRELLMIILLKQVLLVP